MTRLPVLLAALGLLLSSCGISSGTSSVPLQESEPNDTFATATATQLGRSVRGSLETIGDDDWFKLDLTAGDIVAIEVFAQRLDQAGWTAFGNAARVELYAPDGTTRLLEQGPDVFGWAGSQDTDVVAFRVPSGGTHYLLVEPVVPAAPGGDYLVSIRRSEVGAGLRLEQEAVGTSGANDSDATAEALVPGTLLGWHENGDVDWFRFTITEPSLVEMTIVAHRNGLVAGASEPYDAELFLYDAGLNVLVDADDAYYLDGAIEYLFQSPGTYYLAVSQCCPGGDAPYYLTYERTPLGGLDTLAESEPNDSRAGAQGLQFGQILTGSLDVGSEDFYAVTCNAGDRIAVKVFGTEGLQDASFEVVVEIQDALGAPLVAATGSELYIHRTMLRTTGTYFVRVSQPSGSGTSTYGLLATQVGSGYESEANGSIALARAVDAKGRGAGVIGTISDADYWSFQATAGVPVLIDCLADGAPSTNGFEQHNDFGSDMSPILVVRSSGGTVLTLADCDLGVLNGVIDGLPTATLVFEPPATGTYYLEVGDTTAGAGPTYQYALSIR
jgi:hypothetical protein